MSMGGIILLILGVAWVVVEIAHLEMNTNLIHKDLKRIAKILEERKEGE